MSSPCRKVSYESKRTHRVFGVRIFLLLLPFRRGEVWARWAIPAVGMCAAVPGLYATIYVTQNTLATAPWAATAAGIFLMLIGLGLSLAAGPMTGAGKNRDLAEDE